MIPILISVAFFTLIERKLIGLSHFRLGPNKVGLLGIFQPFRDAVKLLTKENIKLNKTNRLIFTKAPVAFIMIALAMWLIYPTASNYSKINITIIYFITILRLRIFFFITRGWSSVSKYRIIGSYRATAQTISYEITIIIIILPRLLIFMNINLRRKNFVRIIMYLIIIIPLLLIWLVTIIAETNRTPFDIAERESELVSGYNTEYSNGQFSIVFIAEYRIFIIIRFFTVLLFINSNRLLTSLLSVASLFIFFVWTRVSFPRIRYDLLINMAWKILIPISIAILIILTVIL